MPGPESGEDTPSLPVTTQQGHPFPMVGVRPATGIPRHEPGHQGGRPTVTWRTPRRSKSIAEEPELGKSGHRRGQAGDARQEDTILRGQSYAEIRCQFISAQSLSWAQLVETSWTAACRASLSITNTQSFLKIMSGIPSNHLILCHPLLLPSVFPSIKVFSNESVLHIMWPKYWSFHFSISPFNEYSGLISFRIAWLDLLAVQGTLKSLL